MRIKNYLLTGLLACMTLLILSSCKKSSTSNNNSNYYVKVNKNGTLLSYPLVTGELGPDQLDASLTDLVIRGQSTDASEVLDIVIQVSGPLTPGTYITGLLSPQVIFDLTIQNGANIKNFRAEDAPGMPPSFFTVTLTTVNQDVVEGTFTGNYLYNDFGTSTPEVMTFTSGEFRINPIP